MGDLLAMKYLSKETCEHLISLGCVSESEMFYASAKLPHGEGYSGFELKPGQYVLAAGETPAFSLEDILRKDNAEKMWGTKGHCKTCGEEYLLCDHEGLPPRPDWQIMAFKVMRTFQSYPDTWPEEVAKLITP